MKILIVDDELVTRKKLEIILKQIGDCQSVENGHEAIKAYKKAISDGCPHDVITLDLDMPELNGFETLNFIRGIENKLGVKKELRTNIIVVTSHSEKPYIERSIKSGCDDYIVKPFDADTVLGKLSKLDSFKEVKKKGKDNDI